MPVDRAAVFVGCLAEQPATPVVLSVPHAGLAVDGFADAIAPALDVRCDADLYADELYPPPQGGSYLVARFSRFVCDLNRDPDEVSSHSVPDHPRAHPNHGRGFIWEVTTAGNPALARPLALDEWRARKATHDAYHAALAQSLERARRCCGYALLIDGHSMPKLGRAGHPDTGRTRPQVVLGDRLGTTCDPALSRFVADHFRSRGLSVACNDPYRGGYVVAQHGRPSDGIHALQIELRRDLYMDEATYQRLRQPMAVLRAVIADLLRDLAAFSPEQPKRARDGASPR